MGEAGLAKNPPPTVSRTSGEVAVRARQQNALRRWYERMSFRGLRPPTVIAARLVAALLFVAAWELAARMETDFVSGPGPTMERVWEWAQDGTLVDNVTVTVTEVVIGFVLAAVIGVVLGCLVSAVRVLDAATRPFVDVANAIPRIGLAPLFVLWFGFGLESKVVLIVSVVAFVVFVNVQAGIESIEPEYVRMVRSLGANRWDVARTVMLPSFMPWLVASLRLGGAYAVAAAVVGEFIGAGEGIGFLLAYNTSVLDTTGAFAALVVLAGVAWILTVATMAVERRVLAWRGAGGEDGVGPRATI